MHIIKVAVFSAEDCQTLAKAKRFLNLVYPLITEPLLPAGARRYDANAPERRVLNIAPFDPIPVDRVVLAHETLVAIHTQIVTESDATHWLGLSATPTEETSLRMAHVLASERTGQQRLVKDACDIIEEALAQLDGQADSLTAIRESCYEDA